MILKRKKSKCFSKAKCTTKQICLFVHPVLHSFKKKYLLNAWFAPAIVFGTSDLQMNYMSGEQVCMERPFYWGRQIVHK